MTKGNHQLFGVQNPNKGGKSWEIYGDFEVWFQVALFVEVACSVRIQGEVMTGNALK